MATAYRDRGYSKQVTWASVQAIDVKFSQDLTHQKSTSSSAIADRPRDARVTATAKLRSGIFEPPFWGA